MCKISNSLKLIELLVRLQKRVLHDIFGVFAVLRDVLRDTEELPLIFADQRVECRNITSANPFNKGYVGMLLVFSCNRLDGRHGGWLRNSAIRPKHAGSLRLSVKEAFRWANEEFFQNGHPRQPWPFPKALYGTGTTLFSAQPDQAYIGSMSPILSPHPMRRLAQLLATAFCALLAVASVEGKRDDPRPPAPANSTASTPQKTKKPPTHPARSPPTRLLTLRQQESSASSKKRSTASAKKSATTPRGRKKYVSPARTPPARRMPTRSSLPLSPRLNCGRWPSSYPPCARRPRMPV